MENKVNKTEMSTLPKIVAVDFDGTLVEDKFPEIGRPRAERFHIIRQMQAAGIRVILWTCRDHESLKAAVDWCLKEQGIVFDAVNENIPEVKAMFSNDTRKVYADIYLDDKAALDYCTPYHLADRLGMLYRSEGGFRSAV